MTPESIEGRLLPDKIELLLPTLELVVREDLHGDPVLVALREAA